MIGALERIQIKLWVAVAEKVRNHKVVVRPDKQFDLINLALHQLLSVGSPVVLKQKPTLLGRVSCTCLLILRLLLSLKIIQIDNRNGLTQLDGVLLLIQIDVLEMRVTLGAHQQVLYLC